MGPGVRRDDSENRALRIARPPCDNSPLINAFRVPNESADTGKSLAPDAGRQCRRADRGVSLQARPRALRPLHPSVGRLSFRLHQARADRRGGVAVCREGAGVAGVRAVRRGLAGHNRPVHKTVPANFWLRRSASAAVRVDGRIAVLPEEFHAYARPFRHLWLRAGDWPAADPGAIDRFRAARRPRLDDPHSDPPHSSPDVCADHRGHRGAALLPGAGI